MRSDPTRRAPLRGRGALGALVLLGLLAWDYWPAWVDFLGGPGPADHSSNWRVW